MKWFCAMVTLFATSAWLSAQSIPSSKQQSEPIHAAPTTNLAMGQWRFVSIGGAAVRAVGRQQPYLKFEERNHNVTGFTGCNRLRGQYTAGESTLSFRQMITSRMACAGESYEREVLEVLRSATGYKIVDHELHLLGSNGTLALLIRPHQEQTTQKKPAEE
jgi:heat shock protein HslJ